MISYYKEDNIGFITINRPERLNALSVSLLNEFKKVLNEINYDDINCLLISGAGERAFVAGADISEMVSMSREEAGSYSKIGNEVMQKIEKIPVPTIAVINGYTLGGGCELALSCDMRICSLKSKFSFPETSLGITPGFGGLYRLSKIIGISRAKEMVFCANMIDAETSFKYGLVNCVCDENDLKVRAIEIAKRISNNSKSAVINAKKGIDYYSKIRDIDFEKEYELFSDNFEGNDYIERMNNFLNK